MNIIPCTECGIKFETMNEYITHMVYNEGWHNKLIKQQLQNYLTLAIISNEEMEEVFQILDK